MGQSDFYVNLSNVFHAWNTPTFSLSRPPTHPTPNLGLTVHSAPRFWWLST